MISLVLLSVGIAGFTAYLVHELTYVISTSETMQLTSAYAVLVANLFAFFLHPMLIAYEGYAIVAFLFVYLVTVKLNIHTK